MKMQNWAGLGAAPEGTGQAVHGWGRGSRQGGQAGCPMSGWEHCEVRPPCTYRVGSEQHCPSSLGALGSTHSLPPGCVPGASSGEGEDDVFSPLHQYCVIFFF